MTQTVYQNLEKSGQTKCTCAFPSATVFPPLAGGIKVPVLQKGSMPLKSKADEKKNVENMIKI